MYVRWKRQQTAVAPDRRRGQEPGPAAGARRAAVLVECRRVGGQPRQRVVRYLGSIREERLGSVAARARFWQGVDEKLGAVPLTPSERTRAEAALAAVVPRPDPAEAAAEAAARAAKIGALTAELRRLSGGR